MKNFVILLMGISGSGKTTIANNLREKLKEQAVNSEILDGDETRQLVSNAFGHDRSGRTSMGYVNRAIGYYLHRNGINVIYALVCPYEEMRKQFREFFGDSYIEVYVKTDVEVCRQRDVKGYYGLAEANKMDHLNGTTEVYEEPKNSDIILETASLTVDEESEIIIEYLRKHQYL
jgi:adenylyl-sulfate kinase